MARSPKSLILTLAALMIAFLVPADAAQAQSTTVVGPGQSIQAAVDAAHPGDTILVFGTHRENVAIQTDGITVRGVRAVILPPAVPAVHACFDPSEVAEAVHGICVIGDVDFETGDVSRYVENVTVQGFAIRDFVGSGVAVVAARDTAVDGNDLADNTDAGINVSTSLDTQIRGNRISGSRFGITLAAASGGAIVANAMRENCVGAALLGTVDGFRLVANDISRNRKACPPAGEVPAVSGIGVALAGAADNVIAANRIIANVPSGDTAFSGGVVLVASASGDLVTGNVILRNDPDLFWDETGAGNVFRHNVCRTSVPTTLCATPRPARG
jgi:parallel beta-helix repeat protein